ncbi:DUF881 domain-containing protein [Nocardioides sp. SYSU DS0663]|uniref:DUF881 domain-containing protein n=1 Tax=Nocardioides sp. SYSU DS0663 TaxID=3416445 RepID=UPI003F4C01E2
MPEPGPEQQPADDGRERAAAVQERAALPLLTLITQQSLDEDYLHAAERRVRAAAAGGGERRPSRAGPHRTAAAVAAVFGILVTTAAVQTSQNEDVDAAGRATLLRQISDERERVARLQDRVVTMRERNVQLDQELTRTRTTYQDVASRLRRLGVVAGYAAVQGPGIAVTLDDGPPEVEDSMVYDRDLRLVANALWRAGAEAIAINGQRLTSSSAIRMSGLTVRVNRVNLSPPYVVEAIGDQRTLQADLLNSREGDALLAAAERYGLTFTMRDDDSLELPSARLRDLRHAGPLEGDGPRPPEDAL